MHVNKNIIRKTIEDLGNLQIGVSDILETLKVGKNHCGPTTKPALLSAQIHT